jgi:hypothetical protein
MCSRKRSILSGAGVSHQAASMRGNDGSRLARAGAPHVGHGNGRASESIRKSIVCGMSSEGNIGRGYRVPISGGDFGMGVRTPTARNDPPPTHHQDCRERAESTQISHSRQSATRGFSAKSQRQVTGNVGEYTETFEHHSCGDLSLTHLVRAQQERLRDRKPERLRGVEIDHQFELRGLLNRK